MGLFRRQNVEELILRITAVHASLEILVRQIDQTKCKCPVWPEINQTLEQLDELRADIHKETSK